MTPVIHDLLEQRARRDRRDGVIMLFAILAALALALFGTQRAFAAPADGIVVVERTAESVTVSVRGVLNTDDVSRLRSALHGATRPVLLLDTPGGDPLAAMRMGRLAREAGAAAIVTGRCASACIYLFAGAVERYAPEHAIGIHQTTLTRFVAGVGIVEVAASASDFAREATRYVRDESRRYFQAMGVAENFHRDMQAVAARDMRWLTTAELNRFGMAVAGAALPATRGDVFAQAAF